MLKRLFTNTHHFILFCLIALLALGGCATIFSDGEDVVTFNSNAHKTKVFLNGKKIGETPLTISLDRMIQNQTLKFTKEGYQTQEMLLAKTFNDSTAMVLDITGTATFLTPMAVDAISGDMIRYSPTDYHIEMIPEKTGDLKLFRQRVTSMRFAAYNFPGIQKDLIIGEGEYLDSLQTSFRVPRVHKEAFKEALQTNLHMLISSDNGLAFWNHLNRLIKNDPILNKYHLG